MSNRYYNFLSNRLINWLNDRKDLKPGDKYFVLLDNLSEAESFYESLEMSDIEGKSTFYSEEFDYKTISIKKDGMNVLFVVPINGITQDFLVTVRNRVNSNIGEWENTAVLFIVFDALDSIIGGAFDVSQKDAPFHIKTIRSEIKNEIEKQESLSFGKREALTLYLEEITDNTNAILKDYETVFSILEKGEMEIEDFNAMGYFPDQSLESIPEKAIRARLESNRQAFTKVEGLHKYMSDEDKFGDEFSGENLIKKLNRPDLWRETEYRDVEKGIQEKNKDKDIVLNFDLNSFSDNKDTSWVRLEGDKGVKSKKVHMLLSSENIDEDTFSFELYFDNNVSKSSIITANTFLFEGHGTKKEDFEIVSKGKKLVVTINNFNKFSTYGGLIRYRHKGVNKLTFNVYFMIVPFNLSQLSAIRPEFKIEVRKGKKSFYYGISSDIKDYIFGSQVDNIIEAYSLSDINGVNVFNSKIELQDSLFDEEDNGVLHANARINGSFFPLSFLDLTEKPIPAQPLSIEKQRLEASDTQFVFDDNKIITGSNMMSIEKLYKDRLLIEKEMVKYHSVYGEIKGNRYLKEDLFIPASVFNAYEALFQFYEREETIPSLAIMSDEYRLILQTIVKEVESELSKNLIEGEKIPEEISNLSQLGTAVEDDKISFSPINPLMIAYQLELERQLSQNSSVPRENILSTLNPQYLLPYMKFKDEEYQSFYTKSIPRWLFYTKMEDRQLSDLASNVIVHRLDDYITQYKFLFETNNNMSLNIAAIRIVDEVSFFDAIINFIFNRLKSVKTLDEINPINIYFDNLGVQINSLFHELYEVNSLDKLNNLLKNTYKGSSFEDYEVIEVLQKKINVYKLPQTTNFDDLGLFFHITFYQFMQHKGISNAKMKKLGKNYSLGGLISSPQYYKELNSYSNGFGIGEVEEDSRTPLIDFVIGWNSFIASSNKETDIYRLDDTFVNNIPQLTQDEIVPILNNSSWVTLLNLDVDLSYFFDETNGEMLVIHYTDQSTASQYESVTITNDIKQYDRLLKETLFEELSDRKKFDTKEVIKNFNVINGQWLLKLISDKTKKRHNSNLLREKLSIISAYKEMLGILEHDDFYWVPISLEEILRVSGMVGLSMKEGLFSSKNLGKSGATSDDLLFVGIDLRQEKINLHFLPVEVKVGQNASSVTEKAFKQVTQTSEILREFLGDDNENTFMKNYYRNFFVSLTLGNLEKMLSSGVFTKQDIPNYQEIKDKLTIGEYDISYELDQYFGQGVVFEFSKNETVRKVNLILSRNLLLIRVPENDAYNVVADTTKMIVENIQKGSFDFRKDVLLSTKLQKNRDVNETMEYIGDSSNITDTIEETVIPLESVIVEEIEQDIPEVEIDIVNEIAVESSDSENEPESNIRSLTDTRILLGEVAGSTGKIYWEFGNKKLANRHLFITGKSGQGKTYFVQTLLSELSKAQIDSLVIDYTEGFLPNQLDPQFVSSFDDKLRHRIIYQDKLPINPFKLQEIDLGGFVVPESEQDMVDRVVQVIDFVFDLGIQQRTLLSETILQGYRINGSSYRFSHLSDELRYSEEKSLQNLYGRISALLSRDPFSYESDFDWSQVFGSEGTINIFQLKGYQLNVQKVLIEFLLWDLFQYATRTGNESKPLPIVLDEVQNLDFSGSSPAVKILREGRKFGVSGIFATQSLDSIKGNDAEAIYNAAEQLHFLPPDSQVSAIARSITSNSNDRKDIEGELKTLLKGQAIVYGPVQTENGDLTEPRLNTVKISSFEQRK